MKPGVVFKDYSPGPSMESLCRHILDDIAKAAPDGAVVSLRVEKKDDTEFNARIEVRSKNGNFLGRGQDVFDSVAASKAAKHLMDSLVMWKRGKFDSPIARA